MGERKLEMASQYSRRNKNGIRLDGMAESAFRKHFVFSM